MEAIKKCNSIITRGERKGEVCNMPLRKGNPEKCYKHSPTDLVKATKKKHNDKVKSSDPNKNRISNMPQLAKIEEESIIPSPVVSNPNDLIQPLPSLKTEFVKKSRGRKPKESKPLVEVVINK